jgi:NADP-dependent 3-hydroxy acid dehydrogenase YdfG
MKIAITGHTKGIGKGIFDHLTENNYDIVGYSRSNGWNIDDYHRCSREISNYDCFINNAYSFSNGYSQTELLRNVWKQWKGNASKIIICMGSYGTDFIQPRDHPYIIHKHALDQTVKQLRAASQFPKIVNIRPSYVNVERLSHIDAKKINPEEIGKIIDFIIKNKNNFQILDLSLAK